MGRRPADALSGACTLHLVLTTAPRFTRAQVVDGMDVVTSIETTPTGPGDRPNEAVVVNTIEISTD